MTGRGRISAVQVTLLGEHDRPIARGMVSIDVDEGAPEVITWEGETYLRIDGVMLYRKTRVMHAGAGFEAVPR